MTTLKGTYGKTVEIEKRTPEYTGVTLTGRHGEMKRDVVCIADLLSAVSAEFNVAVFPLDHLPEVQADVAHRTVAYYDAQIRTLLARRQIALAREAEPVTIPRALARALRDDLDSVTNVNIRRADIVPADWPAAREFMTLMREV